MAGLFSNPANWKLTNTIQGDQGGYTGRDLVNGAKRILPNSLDPVINVADKYDVPSKVASYVPNSNLNPTTAGRYVQGASTTKPSGNVLDPTGKPIPDETRADNGTYGTGSGSAGTNAAGYTQAELDALNAQYDTKINALRGQLGLMDSTQRLGLNELNNSYNNKLNDGVTNYGVQRTDNDQARLGKLEGVDNDARSGFEGLRRLIGLSGSANQSALQNAKFAVAKDASGKRANAIDMYGRNTRDIDTAEQQFRKNLELEKGEREKSFLQGLLEQRNSLEAEIGDADMQRQAITGASYDRIRAAYTPYQQRIDANNAALSDLTAKYATKLDTNADRPQLADYTVDKTAIAAADQTGGEDQFSPYSAFLNRKRLENQA